MDDLGRLKGRYPENLEDMVIPDVMDDVYPPQGRYPENFVLISQLEVCQDWRGQEGGGVLGGH